MPSSSKPPKFFGSKDDPMGHQEKTLNEAVGKVRVWAQSQEKSRRRTKNQLRDYENEYNNPRRIVGWWDDGTPEYAPGFGPADDPLFGLFGFNPTVVNPGYYGYVPVGGGFGFPVVLAPSDRNLKENAVAADVHGVLQRLAEIPISTWNYKFEDATIRHIGPMAQDCHAAFGFGASDKHVALVDAHGVSMAAIQSLYAIVKERDTEIAQLRRRLDTLEAAMRELSNDVMNGRK